VEEKHILLAHGSGGQLTRELIEKVIVEPFRNPILSLLQDSAIFSREGLKFAFTTDSFVVKPIFFPGGDIGRLAICGTVNDLAMSGAVPLYLSSSLILEEGFPLGDLEKILDSMRQAAEEAEITVITGDTKVVEKESADGIFINTAGIGLIKNDVEISPFQIRVGDKIIVSGYIGDHGMAVLSEREGLSFRTGLKSDCAPLNKLVAKMLQVSKKIHCLRDPTRGGLAAVLNELSRQSGPGMIIEEEKVPLREEVKAASEILGIDPFQVANEGILVAIVDSQEAEKIVAAIRETPWGKAAEIIGEVIPYPEGMVLLKTGVGGTRILDMPAGEILPRIC